MLPFSVADSLILACHITGVYDVNRSNTLPNDAYSLVSDWADSITRLGLNGVLFHNNFTEETCRKYQNKHLAFVKITPENQFNPNVFRYFVYRNFLQTYPKQTKNLFITDVSDVVLLKNPFVQPLFVKNPMALFCGDEPKLLDNEWMKDHATHLRSRMTDYADYETNFRASTLLNCGIIGGNITVMQPFIDQLCGIHQAYNYDNKTTYTGDMGAFNYLVRTRFNNLLFHGSPVNTVFKAYQNDRTDCWFRHK